MNKFFDRLNVIPIPISNAASSNSISTKSHSYPYIHTSSIVHPKFFPSKRSQNHVRPQPNHADQELMGEQLSKDISETPLFRLSIDFR